MITSGIRLLWKPTLVTDWITKKPAPTSNLYFPKPRWTFRDHSPRFSFSRASRWIVCLVQSRRAPVFSITHRGTPYSPGSQPTGWKLHSPRRNRERTKLCLSQLGSPSCHPNFWPGASSPSLHSLSKLQRGKKRFKGNTLKIIFQEKTKYRFSLCRTNY